MKKTLLSIIAVASLGTSASAQMYIVKDGKVRAAMENTPDYVTFEEPVPSSSQSGDKAVDLGLSVKWASYNIGATKPEEFGSYFSWGETETKERYDWSTYKYIKEGSVDYIGINKYTIEDNNTDGDWYNVTYDFIGDGIGKLTKSDDVASVTLGGDWVTPTAENYQELIDKCTWEFTTENEIAGYKITGTNGKSIFLPAAGYYIGTSLRNVGSVCDYWAADLYQKSSYGENLYCRTDGYEVTYRSRHYGHTIRPVSPAGGDTNGHEAVDLGLESKVLWASCNIGAEVPEGYGNYYAWGEIEVKENFMWSTYKFMQDGQASWQYINKYQTDGGQYESSWYSKNVEFVGDGKGELESTDDAATVQWGEEWRMPTASEIEELCNNCVWLWTDDYKGTGVKGNIVISKMPGYEGNSIFLPAAGYYDGMDLLNVGEDYSYLWTSSLNESNSGYGKHLKFGQNGGNSGSYYRCQGNTVRPVQSK